MGQKRTFTTCPLRRYCERMWRFAERLCSVALATSPDLCCCRCSCWCVVRSNGSGLRSLIAGRTYRKDRNCGQQLRPVPIMHFCEHASSLAPDQPILACQRLQHL